MFFFFFPDCYDGLQTQIHLYAENIFFSFYAKSFSGAFTNEFLFGVSRPGTIFYLNTCFLVCQSFLLTIAIRTSLLSDWQLLEVVRKLPGRAQSAACDTLPHLVDCGVFHPNNAALDLASQLEA